MKLRFTNHAKYRVLIERRISTEKVKSVIRKPDASKQLRGGLTKSERIIDKRTLIVVYSKDKAGEYVIITAYFK